MSEKLPPDFVKPTEDITWLGDVAIFPKLRMLVGQNELVKLTEEEFRLFKLLWDNIFSVVSYDTIAKTLWPHGKRTAEAIRQIVRRLDKAIKSITQEVKIKNDYGTGYYLLVL